MALSPIPGPAFRSRTFSNVQPFTYEDGLTVAETISRWLHYFSTEVLPQINEGIPGEIDRLEALIADLQAQITEKGEDIDQVHIRIDGVDVRIDGIEDMVQAIIDNSIVAQDPVVAALVNDALSETFQALNERFVQVDSLVFNAADHGVVGDGVADDTVTMQDLMDQVPDGSTIVAPPGAVYRTDGWKISNRSLNLDLRNAHLVKTGNSPIFDAEGSFDTAVLVGDVTRSLQTSHVTVIDSSTFTPGDIVKVFSNDQIFDARPRSDTEFAHRGEFAVVVSTSGGLVKVSPPLIDTYNTNIRIAKIQRHKVDFRFGTAGFEGGQGGAFSGGMFAFRGLAGAHISGHVTRGPGTAFSDGSCAYTTADLRVENLPAADGYGVVCAASSWGHYNIVANRLRHAFTDDTAGRLETGASTDPVRFGRAMYARVTGSSAQTSAVSWDTHHGGYGHHFYNITATGASARWLYRVRGRAHTISDCIAIGAESGFGVMAETGLGGRGTSTEHRFVNCATYGVGQPFNVAKDTLDDPNADSVVVEGGRYEFNRQGPSIDFGYVRMVGVTLIYTGEEMPLGPGFFDVRRGRLTGSATLEANSVTSGTLAAIVRGSTAPVGTDDVDVDLELRLSSTVRHATTALIEWRGLQGQVRARVWGNHSMVPSATMNADADRQSVILSVLNANRARTTAFQSNTPPDGAFLPITSGDPAVTARINISGATTLGGISPGAFSGQLLNVYARGSGGVTIPNGVIPHNVVLDGGQDATLAHGDAIRLVWDRDTPTWVQLT